MYRNKDLDNNNILSRLKTGVDVILRDGKVLHEKELFVFFDEEDLLDYLKIRKEDVLEYRVEGVSRSVSLALNNWNIFLKMDDDSQRLVEAYMDVCGYTIFDWGMESIKKSAEYNLEGQYKDFREFAKEKVELNTKGCEWIRDFIEYDKLIKVLKTKYVMSGKYVFRF